jgi:uncharacterized membrane protein YkvA (DUF1232 family)
MPLRDWARRIKRDLVAVYHAARDPRTPRLAKVLGLAVVAYALSPIDLIPDVIPVLGLLDDVILVPLGLILVMRLIPSAVLAEHRANAARDERLPHSRLAAFFVVGIWIALAMAVAWWLWP